MPDSHDTPDLVFIHLSDIHFREGHSGDLHDKDSAVRHELELDLRSLRLRFPRLDGILISGDIAFGGKKAEYEFAAGWIERIRELLDCNPSGVLVTPGNHDVDRDLIPRGGDIDSLHASVRQGRSITECDDTLACILRDQARGEKLLAPLTEYNAFAANYGCRITRDTPFWERPFPLSDGTTFLIRGITTVLLSGPRDNDRSEKMLYGSAQRTILRHPDIRRAIIGHHPPSWTLETDEVDRSYSNMTLLQAFGHKHSQWITQLGSGVRIISGALHPARDEQQWVPRYSAISLSVLDASVLGVRIYPRRWSDEEDMFIPDINSKREDYREYSLPIPPRQGR